MGTVLLRFLVGGIAGLLAWMLVEPFYPKTLTSASEGAEGWMVLLAGIFIGGSIAGLSGYAQGGTRHTMRGLGLGALFGAFGVFAGYGLGSSLVSTIFGSGVFIRGESLPVTMMARMLAILPMGAFLGLAVGGATLNMKRTVQGVIGGLIAGAVAGFAFDPIAQAMGGVILKLQGQQRGDVAAVSRAVTFWLLGASIGLFIGLVERIARSAWLRLQLGKNEGKEWSIDSGQTFIGRSEGAHVPLFGDPNIAPVHCSIQRHGKDYVLVDGGSPLGTLLNGHRIQSALLAPGSQIQVGSFVLQFLVRNQPAPARGPEAYAGQAYPYGGVPQPGPAPMPGYAPVPGPQPMAPMAPMPGAPMPGGPMPGAPTQVMPGMPAPGAQTQVMPGMGGSMPTMAYGSGPIGGGFTLVAIDGPMVGHRFPVNGPVEIGREGAGVRLGHDANASRRHAVIQPGMGNVAVQDLGSTNGTFVNGQRVSQANAGPGDLIKVGSTTFRVEPG